MKTDCPCLPSNTPKTKIIFRENDSRGCEFYLSLTTDQVNFIQFIKENTDLFDDVNIDILDDSLPWQEV